MNDKDNSGKSGFAENPSTGPDRTLPAEGRRFLLVKRGLYYRPANAGYTGLKREAGRYHASEAPAASGVTAIHEDDALEFSPACWEETKLAEKDTTIAALKAELAEARRALAQGVAWFTEYADDHECKAGQASDACEHRARQDKAKRNRARAAFLAIAAHD